MTFLGVSNRLRSLWSDTRVVLAVLTGLALAIYITGFRAAGFAWFDAVGAGSAHVLPGALAGLAAWRTQPAISRRTAKPLLHGAAAIATATLWLGLMLAVTALAKPAEVAVIARNASLPTFASGVVLYAAVAMISALVASIRRAEETAAAAARAELAALRARVEPHFLYNALESISSLMGSDPLAAQSAMAQLGRLLRRVLDQPATEGADAMWSVGEEMALVRDYLAIEKLRMGDRLQVVEHVAPLAEGAAIPAFAVQSLAENAIRHGLHPRAQGGTLSLTADFECGQVVIVVADDGCGAEEDALGASARGIALLRRRMALHFPEGSVDLAAAPGRGVSVRLAFPAREAE